MSEQEVLELMLTLMRSTADYTHKRIESKDLKGAYQCAMTQCITYMKNTIYEKSCIFTAWDRMNSVKVHINKFYPDHWYSFNNENRKYYTMAVDQCLEIVEKLEARFVTGASDTDPRMFRGKGLTVYKEGEFKSY